MADQDSMVSRRQFVKTTLGTAAALTIVPRHVLGRGFQAPSDLVNVAVVGVTGMGASNTRAVMSQNIVALCDVDLDLLDRTLAGWAKPRPPSQPRPAAPAPPPQPWKDFGLSKAQIAADAKCAANNPEATLARFAEQLPRLAKYQDYREMLEKQKDIDAVIVATPDHMHAPIASAAMSLGKHVYVQKPLCWSVHEARHLAKKARDNPKIVTQMGNQRHSLDVSRRGVEYVMNGALGDVREVHVWTNRPLGFWPQGIPRPAALSTDPAQLPWNNRGIMQRLGAAMAGANGGFKVPDRLAWDLFLGVAPQVEYHPVYHPFNWRGWVDWGQGALGDMGAHLVDFPFWALELGMPTAIETISTPFNDICFPNATTTYFEFAARGNKPAVKMTWYDGGLLPPRPAEFSDEMIERNGRMVYKDQVDPGGGVMFIGSKGKLMHETYGYRPRLLPQSLHDSYGKPKQTLTRIQTTHEMNWVDAAKGKTAASCPFDYAARLVEVMLLGVVSLRARSKIYYDAENMRITNLPSANSLLKREYRAGFKLT